MKDWQKKTWVKSEAAAGNWEQNIKALPLLIYDFFKKERKKEK